MEDPSGIYFTVVGDPHGKDRPRFGRHGGAYTPTKTKNYEKEVRKQYNKIYSHRTPMTEPLEMTVIAWFKRPKSHYGTGKNVFTLKSTAPAACTKTPDLDNIIKIVMDALNEVAYIDDSQIVKLTACKAYDLIPRVDIKINKI